jgi:hypothetical protein
VQIKRDSRLEVYSSDGAALALNLIVARERVEVITHDVGKGAVVTRRNSAEPFEEQKKGVNLL